MGDVLVPGRTSRCGSSTTVRHSARVQIAQRALTITMGVLIAAATLSGCSGTKERHALRIDAASAAPAEVVSSASATPTMSDEESSASEAASASAAAEAEAAAQAEAERLDTASYTDITARDWELLSRDPDAHLGERYQIYGYVTQFDSFTGPSLFRAQTGGDGGYAWYEYDINTILDASHDPEIVADLITDDMFVAYVEVAGSYDYDTTIGGTATSVLARVNMLEVTGTTD